jgi:hypothetical protein
MPIALALVLSSAVVSVAEGQAVRTPRLRPTPEMFEGAIARVSVVRTSTTESSWRDAGMSPITKGMLIGGGIGLGATALLSVLYIQSTQSGNYSGIEIPIALGTTLGAIVGAAIGAGFER